MSNEMMDDAAFLRYGPLRKPKPEREVRTTSPVKPPRSVWVSGEAVRYMATKGWPRYDLHRPKPRRGGKGRAK